MVRPGPEQPPELRLPMPYGKYELLERIGDGGMAEVFRARMPGVAGFEKIVVIKRILPHLANKPRIVEMFVAEAKLAAQVQHKNVVQVHELGQSPTGEFFMVMELISGTDLRKALRDATRRGLRLPPWYAVHVVGEILDALSHAHQLRDEQGRYRNIVHRDVTPSNIFLSQLGETKLGDFGIAHDDLRESQTKFGQLKGKIGYMSPEQIRSTPLDGRSDVFSAGVVLWECLAQRRLFGGRPDFEAMTMICNGQRSAIGHHVTDVPPELDAIVHRALEADRDRRFRDAREFQAALLDVLPRLHSGIRHHHLQDVIDGLLGKRPLEAVFGPMTKRTGHEVISGETSQVKNLVEGTAGFTSQPSVSSSVAEPRPQLRPLPPPPPAAISEDLAIETGPVSYEPDPIEPLPPARPSSSPSFSLGPTSSTGYEAIVPRRSGSGAGGTSSGGDRRASDPALSPLPRRSSDASRSGSGERFPAIAAPAPPPPPRAPSGSAHYSVVPPPHHPNYSESLPSRFVAPSNLPPPPSAPPTSARASSGSHPAVPRPSPPPASTYPPAPYSSGTYSGVHSSTPIPASYPPSPAPRPPSGGSYLLTKTNAVDRLPETLPIPGITASSWASINALAPSQPPFPTGSIPLTSADLPHASTGPIALGSNDLLVLDLSGDLKPRPSPPVSAPDSLDIEALVNDAVNSVQIDGGRGQALPAESLLAGLDVRRHASRISDHHRQRWASFGMMGPAYSGPDPFWLADNEGNQIGPVSYDQAIQLVRAEVKARLGADARISVDGQNWMTLLDFGTLSGHDSLLRVDEEEDLPKAVFHGLLEQKSLPSVVGTLAKSPVSGRLIVAERGYRHFEYAEIEIQNGLPVHVYTAEDSLQLPDLLVSKGVVPKESVSVLMSEVIRSKRSFFDIIRQRLGCDFKLYYPGFMKERLVYAFARTSGRWIFDSSYVPQKREPLASSLLAIMPDAVFRGLSAESLRGLVDRYTDAKLEPSERYVEAMREMALTPAQYEWAIRLTKGKKISQLLRGFPEDERLILSMAFILIGTELLRPS